MNALYLCISLINGFSSLISIVSNAFVFVAIVKTPSLHTPNNVLLCSLATSDFAVGLIAQPLFILDRLTPEHEEMVKPLLLYSCTFFVVICSTTLALISLDRFLALHLHLRYHVKVTVKRIRNIVATVWFGFAPLVVIYFIFGTKDMKFVFAVTVPSFISLLILFCHWKICKIIRRHRAQIAAQRQAFQIPAPAQDRSIKMMRYIQSVYVICVLPLLSTIVAGRFVRGQPDVMRTLREITLTILFVSSSLNPYLCCYRSREIRNVVLSMVKWCLCKNKTTELNSGKVIRLKILKSRTPVTAIDIGTEPKSAITDISPT